MDMDTLPVMIRIFYKIGSKLSYFNVSDDVINLLGRGGVLGQGKGSG